MAKFIDDLSIKTNKLRLFFYIKGSKDYPLDHIVTDKFGFNDVTGSETAIFDNSIHNVIQRIKNPKQIENLYSLYSDDTNGIPAMSSKESVRDFREKEFISTMIIADGKIESNNNSVPNAFVDHIIPNYSNDYVSTKEKVKEVMNGAPVDNIYPGEKVFWQKVFTIAEFFKKYEKNIYTEDVYSEYEILPSIFTDLDPELFYGDKESSQYGAIKNRLAAESVPGKYLTLFIGNDKDASTKAENNESYKYNPFRTLEVYGTKDNQSINEKQKNDELLWHKELIENPGNHKTKMLNIKYVPGTCRYSKSDKMNRIAYVEFNLTYGPTAKIPNKEKEWNIRIYLDPDAFVNDTGFSQFKVYTYNDADLENKYGSPSDYNQYDNDYANTLSDDPAIKGNFIASQQEVNDQIMKILTKNLSGGLYKDYVEFRTDRISPKIVLNPETNKHEIIWDNNKHKASQTFYIFYNRRPPTSSEVVKEVKDYIRDLHKDCKPTTYHNNDPTDVKSIGHTESEKEDFLAKMYPSLFSSLSVFLIPIGHRLCVNGHTDEGYELNKYNPDAYFNTVTLDRIYESIHSVSIFNKFVFDPNGNVKLAKPSEPQTLPVETFHIGGIISSVNTGTDEYKFKFPWFCVANDDIQNPLTSKVGFRDYRPKFFKNVNEPATPADKLQYILIKLSEKMFQDTKGAPKTRFKTIAGVAITYKNSKDIDSISSEFNQVEFILNNVQFVIYSQSGKCFATLSSPEPIEEG